MKWNLNSMTRKRIYIHALGIHPQTQMLEVPSIAYNSQHHLVYMSVQPLKWKLIATFEMKAITWLIQVLLMML